MKYYYITFRSVTFAQKGERILKGAGVECAIQRTPRQLSQRGCGYCLQVRPADAMAAVQLLQNASVGYSRVYAVRGDGSIEDVKL